jgi:hypothetical protein
MAKAKKHKRAKLIIGLIAKKGYIEKAKYVLGKKFGFIDFQSDIFEFEHTDYYFKEMGKPLYRQFLSFEKLIRPESLWKIKLLTNKLEKKFSKSGRRQVNIDPGYLTFSKLILASAKDFSHRIALKGGIYAEITLLYQNGDFRNLEWTFPDYRTLTYKQIFKQIRDIYEKQTKERENIS